MKKNIIGFLIGVGLFSCVGFSFAAQDIMEVMFAPSKAHQNIVDLGADKQAVGDEVFRGSIQPGINDNFGKGCFKNNQLITSSELQKEMISAQYTGSENDFCVIFGGNNDASTFKADTQAPLIVRITKFLLRMTIVLSITMVLYNGVLWIVESSKGAEIKDAKNNLIYIFVGILLSLLSIVLVNLVSSLGISSLDPEKLVSTKTDCSLLIEKEKDRSDKNCRLGIFGSCNELKPYHELYVQNSCENYVAPKTTGQNTNNSNGTNKCGSLLIKEDIWIENNCDSKVDDPLCQKYSSSHKQYLSECDQLQ